MTTSADQGMISDDSELGELYRDIILDYYRRPRNRGRLPEASVSRDGHNPLCGDEVTVDLAIDDKVITDVKFDGHGCSISQSSASMMTDAVKGRTLAEAEKLFGTFTNVMKGTEDAEAEQLGDLEALTGVRKFPVRVKCATLAWHTLSDGIRAFLSKKAADPAP